MCGITGYMGAGDFGILRRMTETLSHRGPDDTGHYIGNGVGLGQTRLAILDLSPSGHQPMTNENSSLWVAFNGEIYNHRALRQQLKKKHKFIGTSDTEVIVHLYEEYGEQIFSMLEGMFAIALFDTRAQKLILARDRMGKKPLYWTLQQGTLIFGSELKSLMVHPHFVKELDLLSVNKYFLYEYVPTPHTIYANTWKLAPGTYIVWDGKSVRTQSFWEPTFCDQATSFTQAVCDLDRELRTAVKTRLEADVPVGIFLSGGLDSSTIAYYATQLQPGSIHTFSIGFDEPSFDESEYARAVAKHLGTKHHEEILPVSACLDLLATVSSSLDEPMADPSILPTYLLSRHAHNHVKVALGGDGGDELFAGYDTFLAFKVALLYKRVPRWFREQLRYAIDHIPISHEYMSVDFKLKKATQDFEGDFRYLNQRWLSAFGYEARSSLFKPEIWNKLVHTNEFEDIDMYINRIDSKDPYDALIYTYERMFMMDQVLVKVDRANMMNGLEVRSPFLDTSVVELVNHLPISYKLRGWKRKYILRKLMNGRLPNYIIDRKKQGFGLPVGAWLKGPLENWMRELLSQDALEKTGLFNFSYVHSLVEEHISGKRDNRKPLWTLITFILWWHTWFERDQTGVNEI